MFAGPVSLTVRGECMAHFSHVFCRRVWHVNGFWLEKMTMWTLQCDVLVLPTKREFKALQPLCPSALPCFPGTDSFPTLPLLNGSLWLLFFMVSQQTHTHYLRYWNRRSYPSQHPSFSSADIPELQVLLVRMKLPKRTKQEAESNLTEVRLWWGSEISEGLSSQSSFSLVGCSSDQNVETSLMPLFPSSNQITLLERGEGSEMSCAFKSILL